MMKVACIKFNIASIITILLSVAVAPGLHRECKMFSFSFVIDMMSLRSHRSLINFEEKEEYNNTLTDMT